MTETEFDAEMRRLAAILPKLDEDNTARFAATLRELKRKHIGLAVSRWRDVITHVIDACARTNKMRMLPSLWEFEEAYRLTAPKGGSTTQEQRVTEEELMALAIHLKPEGARAALMFHEKWKQPMPESVLAYLREVAESDRKPATEADAETTSVAVAGAEKCVAITASAPSDGFTDDPDILVTPF